MEVELVTDDTSEDENYGFDDSNEEYLNFEGERCGICSDTVIDRGVLDCCQHWFCFTCIDNWATITSLCPLCQNEFQLITCVPVYDTVGGNKTDDDTGPRDDDWFIEEKNNTLSFPSYYIDENAVVCLDGDGCKLKSGIVAVEEESDIDTSIACDLCDKWYHAFCVGFDPEGASDGSWLCPRCTADTGPQKLDRALDLRKSYQSNFEISNGDSLAETSFSGRVSVSLADEGETAVVISLVDRNQGSQKSSESFLGCGKNVEEPLLSDTVSNVLHSEVLPEDEPKPGQQIMGSSLSEVNCIESSHSMPPIHPKICADDSVERAPTHINSTDSGLNMDLGLSMDSDKLAVKDVIEDHVPESIKPYKSEDPLSAENMEPNSMEVISPKIMIADDKETISRLTGCRRKQTDSSDAHENADDEEKEANNEVKISRKKIKGERNSQFSSQMYETSILEESHTISRNSSRDGKVRCALEKGKGTSIMDIVQGTERKSLKQLRRKDSSNITKEGESAAGLRLKKIMRRAGSDQDSSVLVQEIRQKLREAVRNKSSDDHKQNIFDPKLLDAFRTALAGCGAENRKPTLDVKAKKALLQKGKVRESLTKKIYGAGGKRRRAWTRECEVEFWKHRCTQATKPEKIQTLKSVLDLLRVNSDSEKKVPGHGEEPKGSILSRLYLADSSVFPRKNDIQPVSALNAVTTSEQKRQSGATEKVVPPIDQSDRIPQKQNSESQAVVPPVDGIDKKKTVNGVKTENASVETRRKRDSVGAHTAPGGMNSSEKNVANKSGDRRKWAMELLARKAATSGQCTQDEGNSPVTLKGNYPLLAQLPKEMLPVLASARHNKIPVSARQAQLYRLAEHFLKKADLSTVCKTAETELAVADAVNIEKQIADKSNSKLVYLNLCSQEILRRPVNVDTDQAKESNPSLEAECPPDKACEGNSDSTMDLDVNEALKKAGLLEDSPSNSPSRPTEGIQSETSSAEKIDEEGPDNIFEVDSHLELDIYGDFEYNLEDDDFIGAGSLNVSNHQQEPKIKLLFSSLNPQKPNGNLDLPNHDISTGIEIKAVAVAGSSGLLDSLNVTTAEDSTLDSRLDEGNVRNSSGGDNDEEPSLAEYEELYGPDKDPLVQKFPETPSVTPIDLSFKKELLPGENGDAGRNDTDKNLGQPIGDSVESLEPTTNGSKQPSLKKEKTSRSDARQSEPNGEVMKKVEAYIKEHIRPLCKSGVITVEQYRWAVGKTTEKVMKYHSKEKNANFLIKEGEKVKKLAEQYVESSQQKAKT